MSEWKWQFENSDGATVDVASLPAEQFPSQADAESWIGESWRDLLNSGVDQVFLWEGSREVYGPMSLRPVH